MCVACIARVWICLLLQYQALESYSETLKSYGSAEEYKRVRSRMAELGEPADFESQGQEKEEVDSGDEGFVLSGESS